MSDEPPQCGKVPYDTERDARRALAAIRAEYPPSRKRRRKHAVAHYPCQRCGKYHLTSRKRPRFT